LLWQRTWRECHGSGCYDSSRVGKSRVVTTFTNQKNAVSHDTTTWLRFIKVALIQRGLVFVTMPLSRWCETWKVRCAQALDVFLLYNKTITASITAHKMG
jgi:hypothetical protein